MGQKIREVPLSGELRGVRYYNANWSNDPSLGQTIPMVSSGLRYVQRTETYGHRWPSAKGAAEDIGGDFSTNKIEYTNHTPGIFTSERSYGLQYVGPAWPFDPYMAIQQIKSDSVPASSAKLDQLGATAIARCIPTNPVADASTFIGELRDGLPKAVGKELLKSKLKDYRKIGDEYLNFEFGWKPLVSDIMKFGEAVTKTDSLLEQLHRDSGKTVRRKYTFPVETSSTESVEGGRYCWLPTGVALGSQVYEGSGTLRIGTVKETKTWFSGAFTYHVNLGNTLPDRIARRAAEVRKLYGLELTPEVVWNLTPWSWAADWEGNIGDVLHNVSRFANDGLVLRYGYIMQETSLTRTYTLSRGGIKQKNLNSGDLSMTLKSTLKTRRRATPFGFGFDMTTLTGRQSAILGALGISRAPRR